MSTKYVQIKSSLKISIVYFNTYDICKYLLDVYVALYDVFQYCYLLAIWWAFKEFKSISISELFKTLDLSYLHRKLQIVSHDISKESYSHDISKGEYFFPLASHFSANYVVSKVTNRDWVKIFLQNFWKFCACLYLLTVRVRKTLLKNPSAEPNQAEHN